tara:strand:+ start:4148 stop:4444 length:297 start_codon:yes stop_codon:yes gene_type:complete
MAFHIQFDDSAQEYLQKTLDIMQNIPAESGIEVPPGVHILGGINSSLEPGTLPVKIYFEQLSGGRGSDGVLKFEIDGVGTFSIHIPSEGTAAIPTFQS